MFNIRKEVPSLEVCKRLKKAGFPQGEGYYWYRYSEDEEFYIGLKEEIAWEENPENYYAPLMGEMGEYFPEGYYTKKYDWRWIGKKGLYKDIILADTEPNTRAELLIWLEKNGYVKFEKEKK